MGRVDYIEVFYNQRRRHSTLGQISPAAFERRGRTGCEGSLVNSVRDVNRGDIVRGIVLGVLK